MIKKFIVLFKKYVASHEHIISAREGRPILLNSIPHATATHVVRLYNSLCFYTQVPSSTLKFFSTKNTRVFAKYKQRLLPITHFHM